jgi:hypothetical protein
MRSEERLLLAARNYGQDREYARSCLAAARRNFPNESEAELVTIAIDTMRRVQQGELAVQAQRSLGLVE